ncbi:MAG: LPS export ABC transporter ATP-binding protein [Gammaproteobacteria bacterium]|nr:LPS export ABC transporter ATP-binding protein [Gammaproteobacteria bacterium]
MRQLSAVKINKTFKKKQVVNDVSVDINAGEIVGLLGPNGAGKTTSFYIIGGLIQADSGQVHLDNEPIQHLPMHVRAKKGIGYLAQEASVFRHLSVEDNILAVLENREDLSPLLRQEKLDLLIREFNLDHVRQSLGISLSGGERRRVEIARTLAIEPNFILLDEPFAGVDPISVIDIQQVIKELTKKKIGILITDHNVRETLSICHRAYILNSGQVIASGQPDELLSNNEVRKVYLGESFSL